MIPVDLLRRAGVSDALILKVLELEQAEEAEAKAAFLERKRINQRNYRERCRVTGNTGHSGNTGNKRYPVEQVPRAVSLESKKERRTVELFSKEENISTGGIKRKPNKIPFPEAWLKEPPEEAVELALKHNWGPGRARSEWGRFRDRNLAKGETYADWLAAWRNWVTSPYQKTPSLLDEPDQSWRKAIL